MTTEPDIVERLEKRGTYWQTDKGEVFQPDELSQEAKATIIALRAERDEAQEMYLAAAASSNNNHSACIAAICERDAAEAELSTLREEIEQMHRDAAGASL